MSKNSAGAGNEGLAPGVEGMSPGVVGQNRTIIDFQLEAIGAQLPDTAAEELPRSIGRFDGAERVQALVEIERAIGPPAERIERVMRIRSAKASEKNALVVPFAGSLAVAEM